MSFWTRDFLYYIHQTFWRSGRESGGFLSVRNRVPAFAKISETHRNFSSEWFEAIPVENAKNRWILCQSGGAGKGTEFADIGTKKQEIRKKWWKTGEDYVFRKYASDNIRLKKAYESKKVFQCIKLFLTGDALYSRRVK